MAIPIKKSESSTPAYKLYTGIAELQCVALNPSLKQLNELGYKTEKEPEYVGDSSGFRLDFHLYGFIAGSGVREDIVIRTKHSIWLKPKRIEKLFIDNFGNFNSDSSKLDPASARNPWDGEVDLTTFLQALCNPERGEEFFLDKIDELVMKHDLKELRSTIHGAMANNVKALLGVEDGKRQVVFNKKIEKAWTSNYQYLHKQYIKQLESGFIKAYFGNIGEKYSFVDFRLREYSQDQEFEMADHPAAKPAASAPQPVSGHAKPAEQLYQDTQPSALPNLGQTFYKNSDADELPF